MNYLKILILICLSGCYSPQKSIQKLERKAPEKLAEYCGKEFPVRETIKIDTAYEFFDLVCPDDMVRIDTVIGKDTIVLTKIVKSKSVKTKSVQTKVPTRTITITIKDTASLRIAAIEVQKYKDNAEKLSGKLTSTRNWLLWLVVALAISVCLNVILIRK
jgi:hypothetical protein